MKLPIADDAWEGGLSAILLFYSLGFVTGVFSFVAYLTWCLDNSRW